MRTENPNSADPAIRIQQQISSDLHSLGVRPGDVLLVHSSLSSMGYVQGGPATVIQGLLEALGDGGTLLMPALSYAAVGAASPVFDVLNTPSCIGAIPECFRTMPGVGRSVHPTHSVCGCGARAAELLADHHLDSTPCGEHSPFRRLRDGGGKLLMLGCGLRPNTSMHGVEEMTMPPYLLKEPIDYRIILPQRSEIRMSVRQHNFAGWAQRYDRIEMLLRGEALKTGGVLAARAHLIDLPAMWRAGAAAMKKDPFFFVEQA